MSQSRSKLKRRLEGWVKPPLPELVRDKTGAVVLGHWSNPYPNRKRRRQSEFWRDRTKSKKGAKHRDGSSVYYPDKDPSKSNQQRFNERKQAREEQE